METVEESSPTAICAVPASAVDDTTNDLEAFPLNLSKNISEFLLSWILSSLR
jgi:hypothetical protein